MKTVRNKRAPGIRISASRSEARRLGLSEAMITPCIGTGFIVANVLGICFSHLIASYLWGCGERLKSEKTLKAKSVCRQFILFPRISILNASPGSWEFMSKVLAASLSLSPYL